MTPIGNTYKRLARAIAAARSREPPHAAVPMLADPWHGTCMDPGKAAL